VPLSPIYKFGTGQGAATLLGWKGNMWQKAYCQLTTGFMTVICGLTACDRNQLRAQR